MLKNTKYTSFWIPFLLCSIVYFLVKYLNPFLIESLYSQERFSLLNQLSGVEETLSITGYQGYLQERWIGPFLQLISALLITFLGLKFFVSSNKRRFACLVFIFLMITKFEVLFFPCYGEAGAAPIAEGIWLFENSFDYVGLFHQKNFNFGGPKAYMFSIFPTYVALLLSLIRSPKGFIFAYHLSMFLFGSIIVALFRAFLQKKYDKKTSLLAAMLLLNLPLFQTLVELMNMEILCLLFVMLCAYFLGKKRFLPASIMAVFASLAKGPGGIACGVVFGVSIFLFFCDSEKKYQWKNVLYGFIAVLLGAFKLYLLKTYVNPIQTNDRAIRFFIGWIPLQGSRIILWVYAITTVCVLIVFIREILSKQKGESFFTKYYPAAIAFFMVTAWLGLYLNLSVMGPRYKLIIAPFMIVCALFSLSAFIRSKKILHGLLIFAIAFSGIVSYGLLYRKKIASAPYSFNNLERTLEYRNDLYMNRLLAQTVQKEFPKHTIGAPFVIAQHYAMPFLGYVEDPMEVVMYGMSVDYAKIKPFTGLNTLDLPNTLWIGFANKKNPHGIDFPMNPKYDRLVKKIEYGDKQIFLFQGGVGIQQMAEFLYRMRMQGIQ